MLDPYHKLGNCVGFNREVARLAGLGNCTTQVHAAHQQYYSGLVYKLKMGRANIESLKALLAAIKPEEMLKPDRDYASQINMCIDGFLYASGGVMDILAREVLTIFSIPLPTKVYFHTAETMISSNFPGNGILPRLAKPTWKDEFSNYRNVATHELIVAQNFRISCTVVGTEVRSTLVVPLPDDPRAAPDVRSFTRNEDAVEYLETTLKRIATLVNVVFGELLVQTKAKGSLPL